VAEVRSGLSNALFAARTLKSKRTRTLTLPEFIIALEVLPVWLLGKILIRRALILGVESQVVFFNQFFEGRNIAASKLARMVLIETLSMRACCMNVLAVISPGLKVLFERVGKPEIINRPDFFRLGGSGAVIACNHVGWADSLWMAYAVYPRQLRYMSKQELFSPPLSRWVLEHGGSIPIDRVEPSPSSIKAAVDILQHGGVILIFPTGTRSDENIAFKRGAATIALHARVPLVPAFFQGPKQMQVAHLMHRPQIRVTFGSPIPTAELPPRKETTIALTRQLQAAIGELRSIADPVQFAA